MAIFSLKTGEEIDLGGTGLPIPDSPSPEERLWNLEIRDISRQVS